MKRRVFVGVAAILLGLFLISGKAPQKESAPEPPSYTFESEPVKVEGFSEKDEEEAKEPKRIVIPSLSIDLAVKRASIVKGYWEVFPDSANWGSGSGLPGEIGNQVIFAHARQGLFLPLKEVKPGMSVYVLTEGEWFSYEVREIKEVLPKDVSVIKPTEDETLTLYTCSGFADSKRLIVIAKRV